MPILRLNAIEDGLHLHNSPTCAMSTLRTAARDHGPIVVMVHGFKYDPTNVTYNPHTSIFAWHPRKAHTKSPSWPHDMGFGTGLTREGLAIAFAWPARGTIWQAQRAAHLAGKHLAHVIQAIKEYAPERPVHILTHSMGSEVAFEAMMHLPSQSVDRVVALTGASHTGNAEKAMQTVAGQTAELFNVTSRENDLFDFMFEQLIRSRVKDDHAMGQGVFLPNAINLQMDCPRTLQTLSVFGAEISLSQRRVCHWSGYTRPGAMRFYERLFRNPEGTPMQTLKELLPNEADPRWSRFVKLDRDRQRLSVFTKTAS